MPQMHLFSTLPGELISMLKGIGYSADKVHARAFLIGTYPRSIILKEDCTDIEISVTGNSDKLVEHFINTYPMVKNKKIKRVGRFTLVPSPFSNGDFLSIARARRNEIGGIGNIKSEIFSRGFSIDALAISLSTLDFGKIVDPGGALQDIRSRVLRILHRDIFEIDPKFIFKALVYKIRYTLSMEPITEDLWKHAVSKKYYSKLTEKQIYLELEAIKKEKESKEIIKLLKKHKIIKG